MNKPPKKGKTLPFDQQVARKLQDLNSRPKPVTLIPMDAQEDAVTLRKDVITPSGDAMDAIEGDNPRNGGDCIKTVALSGEKKDIWHENPYLPTQPRLLGTQEKRDRYLVILARKKYHVWAAPEFGCSYWTVMRQMQEDVDFATAVHEVIAQRERTMLARIEAKSEEMAMTDSKVTDRAMQLNALGASKYKRDSKGAQVATQINIQIGFTPPPRPKR